MKYDFSGWATRNDLKCGDGRIIRKDAFKDNDGQIVPLVWNHQHNDPLNVLGHALLENRNEGVYAYCSFNDTDNGQEAKKIVQHGDIMSLSIYANKLTQNGADVIHGAIREVSLVLAGANPGAFIDAVLEHKDTEGEAMIYSCGEAPTLAHSEDSEEKGEEEMGNDEEMSLDEVRDIYEGLDDRQKAAVNRLLGEALEDMDYDDDDEDDEDDEYDEDEDENMKHNVFDNDTRQNDYLSHADMQAIFKNAQRTGSLKEAILDYTDGYGVELMHSTMSGDTENDHAPGYGPTFGIQNIDYLFPDYKNLENVPTFIQRNMDWVSVVMNGVHHTPFSRIKSRFANITAEEARALGYLKGKMKKEEVFTLLKRTTDPQTIYKKQKMDRDDIIDITDFDVVAWIRKEMRMMLDEEIARAILIGDGRLTSSDDHISADHIRPIASDVDLFTIKKHLAANATTKQTINEIIRSRKDYKGSGNPIFFTTEDVLTDMLLLEDDIGHTLYKTEAELATKLRVSRIVTVEVMENQQINGEDLIGVIVNLSDYTVGADKGGQINTFDDFDIDYNQQKYLMETRISGALIKPYSAIVVTKVAASSSEEETSGN